MKRCLLRTTVCILSLFAVMTAASYSSPQPVNAESFCWNMPTNTCMSHYLEITSPVDGASVNGSVQIFGSAGAFKGFQFYKVEISPKICPSSDADWTSISDVNKTPVVDGLLDVWNTEAMPSGWYWMRVLAVTSTGNYTAPCYVRLAVNLSNPGQAPAAAPDARDQLPKAEDVLAALNISKNATQVLPQPLSTVPLPIPTLPYSQPTVPITPPFTYKQFWVFPTVPATSKYAVPTPASVVKPVCNCSRNLYNCSDFASHSQAQSCYLYCLAVKGGDVHRLDGDDDGSACE